MMGNAGIYNNETWYRQWPATVYWSFRPRLGEHSTCAVSGFEG